MFTLVVKSAGLFFIKGEMFFLTSSSSVLPQWAGTAVTRQTPVRELTSSNSGRELAVLSLFVGLLSLSRLILGQRQSCNWSLIKHHTIQVYVGVNVWLHAFLTSALDGGEWSASRPGHFPP
jgi:hypothetical protein